MGLREEQMNMGRLFLNGVNLLFLVFICYLGLNFSAPVIQNISVAPFHNIPKKPFWKSLTFSWRALGGLPGCYSAKQISKWSGMKNGCHRPCLFLLSVWNDKGLKSVFDFFLITLWLLLPNTRRKIIPLDVFTGQAKHLNMNCNCFYTGYAKVFI